MGFAWFEHRNEGRLDQTKCYAQKEFENDTELTVIRDHNAIDAIF